MMVAAQDKKYYLQNFIKSFVQIVFFLSLFSCQGNNHVENNVSATTKFIDAEFVDCVFYAGSTQFFFKRKNGEEFMVSQPHEPDALKIINAEKLIEPNPVEGPPGPNAKILGKLIRIHYDKQNKPTAFNLLE